MPNTQEQNSIDESQKAKEQFMFGVVLAIVTGFVVNIWSNIAYDSLFKEGGSGLHSFWVSALLLLTILVQAFIQFYLKDKYEDGPYTKTFWRRYADYALNRHWVGKAANKINRITVSLFKAVLWVVFIASAAQSKSYVLLGIGLLYILRKGIYWCFMKVRKLLC